MLIYKQTRHKNKVREFVEKNEVIKPVRKLIIKPTVEEIPEPEPIETEKSVIKPTKTKLKIKRNVDIVEGQG